MLYTRIAPAGAALPGLPGGAIVDATNPPGRLSEFMRLVRGFDRNEVGIAVDHLIELLDAADGDADLEEPHLEDSFVAFAGDGPGCPIADGRADVAWIEWCARGRHKSDSGHEPLARRAFRLAMQEDDEDDDPAEQDDEPEDDDSDRCAAGDDQIISGPAAARDQWMTWGPVGHSVGNEDDAEDERPPAYMIDQTRPLFLRPANDWLPA